MSNHDTPFGSVQIREHGVTIEASHGQLYDWAHRPGHAWPCSYLEEVDSVRAGFDANGLVGYLQQPDPGESGYHVPSDEFNAWSSDVLRDVLPEDHPVYFVAVGQFE